MKSIESMTERTLKLLLDIPHLQTTSQEWYGESDPILEDWKTLLTEMLDTIAQITTREEEQIFETMIQELEEGIKEQRNIILKIDAEEETQEYVNMKWREISEEQCYQCGRRAKINYQCNNCKSKQKSHFMVCDECIHDFKCPFCFKKPLREFDNKDETNPEYKAKNISTARSSNDDASAELDNQKTKKNIEPKSSQSTPRRWQKDTLKCECKCGCRKITTSEDKQIKCIACGRAVCRQKCKSSMEGQQDKCHICEEQEERWGVANRSSSSDEEQIDKKSHDKIRKLGKVKRIPQYQKREQKQMNYVDRNPPKNPKTCVHSRTNTSQGSTEHYIAETNTTIRIQKAYCYDCCTHIQVYQENQKEDIVRKYMQSKESENETENAKEDIVRKYMQSKEPENGTENAKEDIVRKYMQSKNQEKEIDKRKETEEEEKRTRNETKKSRSPKETANIAESGTENEEKEK